MDGMTHESASSLLKEHSSDKLLITSFLFVVLEKNSDRLFSFPFDQIWNDGNLMNDWSLKENDSV